jgi:histidinol-phosphatase
MSTGLSCRIRHAGRRDAQCTRPRGAVPCSGCRDHDPAWKTSEGRAIEPTPGGYGAEWSRGQQRGSEAELRSWLDFAIAVCDEADSLALGHFRRDLEITAKPDRSLVTQADRAIERVIRERIMERFPDHGIVGEEYGIMAGEASVRWYVDPIDGTHNFIRGVPLFGTLLAVERDGVRQAGVMSAPAIRERWYAARGLGAWAVGSAGNTGPRRIHVSGVTAVADAQLLYGSSASIERHPRAPGFRRLLHDVWRERGFGDFWGYALVAEGAAEGMIEIGVNPWDLAAPEVIVEESGGRLTDLDGERRIDRLEVFASNGVMHDELLGRLRASGSPGIEPGR